MSSPASVPPDRFHLGLMELCAHALEYPPRPDRTPDVAAVAMVIRALRGAVYGAPKDDAREDMHRAAVALARRFVAVLRGLAELPDDHPRKRPALVAFEGVALAAAEAIETPGAQGLARTWVALARLVAWTAGESAGEAAPSRLPPAKRGPAR